MKESGVIDPTKVTRNALLNASSIAGMILLTECLVVEEEEEKPKANPFAGMDMSGMM
jgi:chaperonin GroEL